jgi:putative ABC transport system substrate-binding protein
MRFARLTVLALLALALLAAPLAAEAQQPGSVHRIGYLQPAPRESTAHMLKALEDGLRELGYVPGGNLVVEYRFADGRAERLPDLAAELVRLKPDVIVVAATTTAVQAARKATTAIPIVMPIAGDPVETGLVASLARPGGNITGLSVMSSQLSGKRLELLKTVAPSVSRVAVLSNATSANIPRQMRETEAAARTLGVQLLPVEVRGPEDLEKAFQSAANGRANALVVLDDFFVFAHATTIVKLAAAHRLVAIYGFREFVQAGGLMAYSVNVADLYHRAAIYVDRILKGAKPADLPVEQPTKFDLVINLKTAKALGLAIPPAVLARVDEVIH